MSRRVIWIGLFVAVVLLSGSANRLMDAAFYPWALAQPSLLDRWVGSFTTAGGNQLTATLEMRRASTRPATSLLCGTCDQIEGSATTCDSHGEMRRYRVSGSPLERHGRIIQLTAKPDDFPSADGLELNALIGTWDGGDVLEMNADYVIRRNTEKKTSSDIASSERSSLQMQRERAVSHVEDCRP